MGENEQLSAPACNCNCNCNLQANESKKEAVPADKVEDWKRGRQKRELSVSELEPRVGQQTETNSGAI